MLLVFFWTMGMIGQQMAGDAGDMAKLFL